MEEKRTLRDILEKDYHLSSESDSQFLVKEGCSDMFVSYRYLDCPAWHYVLDSKVEKIDLENTIYGKMVAFTIEEKE